MATGRGARAREPTLRVGDTISVALDSGKVIGRADDRWLVDSEDDGEIIAWDRFKLRFVSRPPVAETGVVMDKESEEDRAAEEEQKGAGAELPASTEPSLTACGRARSAGEGCGHGRGR
eukprot:6193237-Pleurochrysis_carterae.AAC.1